MTARARTPLRRRRPERPELLPPAATARDVLLARARRYARPPELEDADAGVECLGFRRAGEHYLLETRHVVEVVNRELTRLPGAPPKLLGLANLRGEIVPVFDLALVLGRSADAPRGEVSLIVLGGARADVAICAESLDGTSRLRQHELVDSRPAQEFLCGVTRDARVVLDGRVLLEGPALALDAADSLATGSEVAS